MSFDPSGDFAEVVDGLEAVTLAVSGLADQSILNAHRNQITNAEIEASNGFARQGDTVWQWPVSETPTRPILGSTLTDGDSRTWTILTIFKQVLSSKWSAVCRELAIEETSDTLITIQVATYTKGTHGAPEPAWANVYTSVRAKIQAIDQTPEVEHDADETAEIYRIILAANLSISTVSAAYRVIDADGQIYHVIRYEQPSRIDALPVIVAERTGTSSSSGS